MTADFDDWLSTAERLRASRRRVVVHVIDEMPPHGAERLIVDMMRHARNRFDYALVCLDRGGPLVEELRAMDVPVVLLGRSQTVDLWAIWRLACWFRRAGVAVVHTHLFAADVYGRLAAWFAGVHGIVSTVHNVESIADRGIRRWLDRLLFRISDRVVACSEQVAERIARREPRGAARLARVPNGVDLDRVGAQPMGDVRSALGIASEAVVAAVVGRLHPQKGHHDLFDALARLDADLRVDLQVLIVGDGGLRDQLEQEVVDRGLVGLVRFLGVRSDVPDLLHAADLLLLPSRWEGLPIVLLEAMATSAAVVATRVGGVPDVIDDGRTGLLVEAGDTEAFAQAIGRLIREPALRDRLGIAAGLRVRQEFDVRLTAARYEDIYLGLLEGTGIGAASDVVGGGSA